MLEQIAMTDADVLESYLESGGVRMRKSYN